MILVIVFFSISSTAVAQWSDEAGPDLSYGVSIGYDIGMPVQGHFLVSNLAEGFPFAFRFTISYSFLWDAGIPDAARHVFVNENNNGVPDKSASLWSFGLDFMHQINILSLKDAYLFAGIRHSSFTGTFDFIGGDELFDVNANQWGLATGIDTYFRMGPRIDLLISVSAEYYFPSTLDGHDAAYSPDGEYVNQRQNYTYNDADNAINQPKLIPKLLIGVNFHL